MLTIPFASRYCFFTVLERENPPYEALRTTFFLLLLLVSCDGIFFKFQYTLRLYTNGLIIMDYKRVAW